MRFEELKEKCLNIDKQIQELLKYTGYAEYQEVEVDEINSLDAQGLYEYDAIRNYLYMIDRATGRLSIIAGRKIAEGRLRRNQNGRYEVDGIELTCGSGIDFLCRDGWHDTWGDDGEIIERPYWKHSSIEYAEEHGGYYLTAAPNTPLDGLQVRVMRYQ